MPGIIEQPANEPVISEPASTACPRNGSVRPIFDRRPLDGVLLNQFWRTLVSPFGRFRPVHNLALFPAFLAVESAGTGITDAFKEDSPVLD
ncbi:hypothetical protein [Parvibaculum sp.]|uniref:hypothetical protein n=1 Tax=Parvibaculum sp. TaxID=2024848 RepID=UPI002CD91723|nr:hypothetical protein [Parvibaculum sp.]HUD50196.1 hypothetical protein [Parvibaculum sp.]